ncbi:RagB/SusD family nutrient uptake outer membrane protein [Cellulophaga baltica]|uniref:RagB/SusD family nutrient uptake outer membrane protein n=1 Tax=Cellulophaga baltica TaxID=76594 RepID=UPI00041B456A|nr:RagB/SusD family nutrient uptake outer membrane protein [Cellulophaga baltica]
MKNYKYIILLALAGFTSCQDAIDIEQVGRLTPEVAFETVEDLEDGLFAVYDNYDLTPEIAFNAEYTDEVARGFAGGGQGQNTGLAYILNSGSAASTTFWINGYAELNAVNRLISASEVIEKAEDGSEDALFNDILGQAYALRAFSHFQLLSYYSTDYADDNALGVILVDFVPTVDQQLLRSTNGEIYAAINEDLNIAETLIASQSNPTFVSKDFIRALRTRMAAYRQDYTLAEQLALDLVEDYPLADRAAYKALFLDEDNTEVIFKLERIDNDSYDGQGATGSVVASGWAGARFAFTNGTINGGVYYEFDRSLFNLFDLSDIRYDTFLTDDSVVSSDYQNTANYVQDDILVVGKYPGSEGVPLMNDLKVFRSSEMQLIVAESRAATGRLNGATNSAAAAIKELRDIRFGSDTDLPIYANETEAFAAILNERRIEFAFEGHRWKDIKRMGVRASQGAQRDPLDCVFNGQCGLLPTDYRFTLPIPQVEFNGNPGLREQQNPGY